MNWYKPIKTASSLDSFLSKNIDINIKNQKSLNCSIYDVQRYSMDNYGIIVSMSKSKFKISISVIINHSFLGSVTYSRYWAFNLEEEENAIYSYNKIIDIIKETIEEFIDDEIPTSILAPTLKSKFKSISPKNSIYSTSPYYKNEVISYEEPDWRSNIYGNRYPKYTELSHEESTKPIKKRKGIFHD